MRVNENHKLSTPSTLSEINVTPFVDVMLVLLIVFMVSAPMMQQGVQVNLPKANAGALDEVPDHLLLVIDSRQHISIGDTKIERGTLRARLEGISSAKPNVQVFVQADARVPYGFIAQVMATVKQAKIHRVGLVTAPAEKESSL